MPFLQPVSAAMLLACASPHFNLVSAETVTAAPKISSARDVVDGFNNAGDWSLPPDQQNTKPTWEDFKKTFTSWVDMGTKGDGTTGFSYQFVHPWDPLQVGLEGWYNGEFKAWTSSFIGSQFIPFIEVGGQEALKDNPGNKFVSYAAYMLSDWEEGAPFAGLVPKRFNEVQPSASGDGQESKKRILTVKVRDLDFYQVNPKTKRIDFNWCLVDLIGIFQQGGYDLKLPKSLLTDDPNADYLPPKIMDGAPAPRRYGYLSLDLGRAQRAKAIVAQALFEDFGSPNIDAGAELTTFGQATHWSDSLTWYGPAGIGTAHSKTEFITGFLHPFRIAFSNTNLTYDVLTCEGNYCAAHLHVEGTHVGEFMGIEPGNDSNTAGNFINGSDNNAITAGKRINIRMGLHFRVRDQDVKEGSEDNTPDVIEEGWSQIDLLSVMHQLGRDVIGELQEEAGVSKTTLAELQAQIEGRLFTAKTPKQELMFV